MATKTIETLKFELHQLEEELKNINVSIFTLNPRIPKLIKDIRELRAEIKEAEKNG